MYSSNFCTKKSTVSRAFSELLYYFITFCGVPFIYAAMFSNTMWARFTMASLEAKATCGVQMVFFAFSSGWSPGIGGSIS